MSNNYNLSDNVNPTFPFQIDGKKFEFRYPILEEVEEVQSLSSELDAEQAKADDQKDEAKIKELSDKFMDFVYGFISPIEHQDNIKDVLKKSNIIIVRNFNYMIRKELSV